MKTKKPLAKRVVWENRGGLFDSSKQPTLRLTPRAADSRRMTGPVGDALKAYGAAGRLTFLSAAPDFLADCVMVAGLPHGVVVTLFRGPYNMVTERVNMCVTYRNRITGGRGKVRWAKVKATA